MIDGIRASSQTQEQRIEMLENFQENSEDFIQDSMANTIADEMILNPDNVGTDLYHISPGGSVETIPLDSAGYKIR